MTGSGGVRGPPTGTDPENSRIDVTTFDAREPGENPGLARSGMGDVLDITPLKILREGVEAG